MRQTNQQIAIEQLENKLAEEREQYEERLQAELSPTAPPAETTEDAKALEDARAFAKKHWDVQDGDRMMLTQKSLADKLQAYAEQYAAKQIERQTPDIIWSAFEEVENLVMEWIEPTLSCEECGNCKECVRLSLVDAMNSAMQTVKARQSKGEK